MIRAYGTFRTPRIPHEGRLLDVRGRPFDTGSAVSAHSGGGRAIFVMDEYGNVYASSQHAVGQFHHSSLAGGRPVAAAGELEVRDGVLRLVTDQSGHYQPAREFTLRAVDHLRQAGIRIQDRQIRMIAP